MTQHERLRQSALDRIGKAERVVPKMQATIVFVSRYVCEQVSHLELSPCVSWPCAFAPHGLSPVGLATSSPEAQNELKQQAQTLAEVFQRSSSNVEGRKCTASTAQPAAAG